MFYLKHKGEKLPIREDNVYTTCPRCGKEHHVSIEDVLNDGDLQSTKVYCEQCSDIVSVEHAYGGPVDVSKLP